MSARARRPCARQRFAVFSKKPCGWYSRVISTRVRSGASSWKVTAPSTWPFSPLDSQTIRSSGTCSLIVACQVRWERKTWAFHSSFSSSFWSTFSTFRVKSGMSWN